MRIVCQQTILIKYHALFVIFEKSNTILNCRLLQVIGGTLWVTFEKEEADDTYISICNYSANKEIISTDSECINTLIGI